MPAKVRKIVEIGYERNVENIRQLIPKAGDKNINVRHVTQIAIGQLIEVNKKNPKKFFFIRAK